MPQPELTVVIPVLNEAANITQLYEELKAVLHTETAGEYEIIFIDDGSTDDTFARVQEIHQRDKRVVLLGLSRNFGKEIALAAGIAASRGQAVLTMDGDRQHPVELIPQFIKQWRDGWQVVVGVRSRNQREGIVKRIGSSWFYRLFNRLSGSHLVPGSGDFRLIDRAVQQEFVKLQEPQSITRGLIDWLGFKRTYITYEAKARTAGAPAYKMSKLFRLAMHSFISLSPTPLYAFGYLGIVITTVSFLLGLAVLIEQLLLKDPWHWHFTGTAMLSILVLFLVGLVLVAQGVLALYISYIYAQSKHRPLYVVNPKASVGLDRSRQ